MKLKLKIYFLLLLLAAVVSACQRKVAMSSRSALPIPGIEIIPAKPIVIPEVFSDNVYIGIRHTKEVFDFYRRHDFSTFWLEQNEGTALADSMIMMVRSARRYGLLPQQYHFHEIPQLMLEPSDERKMARLDVILTDAFLAMAGDLKGGRLKGEKSGTKFDSLQVERLMDSLKVAGARAVLESQEPRYDEYMKLKRALNNILDTINTNDQHLLMNGITNDSIETHMSVQRIEINMERWREETVSLNGTYAIVNVPAFMFYVIEQGEPVLESRVVVGAPATPTPMFSSNIECFTIFPYWYVPRKIAVNEYLPVIKKDTTFIIRNNFDILDRSGKVVPLASIDWHKYNAKNFPFTFRQREGNENSLGIIKFVFDNPYAVFVHDTNSKKLFRNKVRAYSHGCIRLEKASEFAHYLIGDNRSKISSNTLDRYLAEQKRVTISITPPVPIHIRYLTANVRGGKLMIYPDIYKKDKILIRKLYNMDVF